VRFGDQPASTQYVSHGFLIATVPPGADPSSVSVGNAPIGRIDDTSPYISYTGSWGVSSVRGYGDFDDNVHYSQVNGNSETLHFTGTGISVYGELNPDQGDVGVSIDGGPATTVDTDSPDGIRQGNDAIFTADGLQPGAHVITVTKLSGTYMTADGFEIVG
jgi:hypothetical protein